MPRLAPPDDPNMETHAIGGSTFHFSAAKIGNLGASEYTLATIVVDGSGSVDPFFSDIRKVLKENVIACQGTPQRPNPRADNLMLRVLIHDQHIIEVHGFKPVRDIDPNEYDNVQQPGGMTAMHDAVYNAVQATVQCAKDLAAKQYTSNGAIFVLTDGMDNYSKVSRKMVAAAMKDAKTSETLESMMPVLIGVNTDATSGLNQYLEDFQKEAEFQQYVRLEDATKEKLMKLGGFISQSISSQSKSLGSGGAPKSLSF